MLPNPAARVAALLSGDVEMIESVPTADIVKISADKRFNVVDKISNRIIYVHFHQVTRQAAVHRHWDGKPLEKESVQGRAGAARSLDGHQPRRHCRAHHGKRAVPAGPTRLADQFYGTSRN